MTHWWEKKVKDKLEYAETKPKFTRASGATDGDNDILFEAADEVFQGECKERNRSNVIVSASDWHHLETQSWNVGRTPVMFCKSAELELAVMDIESYKYLLLCLVRYHSKSPNSVAPNTL